MAALGPEGKSDVYISSRRLGNSVKVSLHESGVARSALTREFLWRGTYEAPEGADPRLATEWKPPRPKPPTGVARAFTILVPWDEVQHREREERGDIVWTTPPPRGMCVHFDLVYVAADALVTGHPGARAMQTELVGAVELENGEKVFVTSLAREMREPLRDQVKKMRSAAILDAEGKLIRKSGMLAFGSEPNPDANDGTFIGTALDVTRPDEN